MIRLHALLILSGLLLTPVLADDASDLNRALEQAVTGAVLADAYMRACDQYDPDSATLRRDAMAGWSHRVDLAGYQRFLEGAASSLPDLSGDIERQAVPARQAVASEVSKDISICSDFSTRLREDAYDIARPIRNLLRLADRFGIEVADAPALPQIDSVELMPLIALSAQLAGKMDEIGSKAGAEQNRDLRAAREEHAMQWLQQRPAVAVLGRITKKDELREWRGDRQSAFAARCLSFAEDAHEDEMERDVGGNRVLVGEVRWLRDDAEGGTLGLRGCRIFVHDPSTVELSSMEDESAGVVLRPPEYEEAFAGAGKGIAEKDIDRVLYDGRFENRLDGFGNGYTDRQESIYVLLRDGTAYRHEWNFAFTDLNVELSRQREPGKWFSWSESSGSLKLTTAGGVDAGGEIDLSEARGLMPVPPGQTWDQTYYYLNVGMGGVRRDRDYAFASNGQLVHKRGGFVAGNFGVNYIIVAGEPDIATSRYSFDGYTLLIDGPDGQERHFAAIFEDDAASAPEEIIIDGQVHWMRKDDE
ncbi:hypothetical protein FPY71_17600 [Aureimonas fodinaquatilis]|uniref:Uncharacterized protein n=1 Tax=Aureimonas fodinaquatilis TaxID=2565783 RepID=A0A5B0DQA2_9HYPH|nr:hypothetical protein [Aureimonas fodinaquatilis]KAA0968145.1 hypothetical protein FPY71_17600 [Aureimonas fodinaquatilis]